DLGCIIPECPENAAQPGQPKRAVAIRVQVGALVIIHSPLEQVAPNALDERGQIRLDLVLIAIAIIGSHPDTDGARDEIALGHVPVGGCDSYRTLHSQILNPVLVQITVHDTESSDELTEQVF